jgi:hypothetical protein
VASYLTELPPKDVLRKKLKEVADVARWRMKWFDANGKRPGRD